MKTITTLSSLLKDNDFNIENYGDYVLIEVTASDGKDSATMAFPWAHTIPFMDVSVQAAITKCQETAKNALASHLEARKKKEDAMTLVDKFFRFLRRELSYFWGMGKIRA